MGRSRPSQLAQSQGEGAWRLIRMVIVFYTWSPIEFPFSIALTCFVYLEARSSPAQSRGRKSNRRGRPPTRGTRSKRLREESRKETAKGDNEDGDSDETGANDNDEAGDQASDAAEDDSDIEEEGEDEEEDGEEEGEEEGDDDDDDEEAGDSPATRSTRAPTTRSKQKDKGAAAGTRRTGRRR